jgi:transcriptional regulator with XRE-family HTH domain
MRVKDPSAILRARTRQRFTQRELALLSRCSQNTIHLIETGKMSTLSEGLAMRIAERLKVDLEDLFAERASSSTAAMSSVKVATGRGCAA